MSYYPIFLNLRDRPVLVVGGGRVALRKTRGLLEAGAQVRVVTPEALLAFDELTVNIVRRRFRSSDVRGMFLVFTATNDRKVNRAVAQAAARQGIPANVADSAEECDFLVPARIRSGDLQVAISTSGTSPNLAVELRRKIEEILRASSR